MSPGSGHSVMAAAGGLGKYYDRHVGVQSTPDVRVAGISGFIAHPENVNQCHLGVSHG